MFEAGYPDLCGGTFFTLVLKARKPGTSSRNHRNGKKDNFLEKDVLKALAIIAIPELVKNISRSGCSEFKHSKKSFFAVTGIPQQPAYCKAFDERVTTQYTSVLNAMEKFVEEYIATESYVQTDCAKGLLELIRNDKNIEQNQKFYVSKEGQALKEAASAEDKLDVYFPALLLGLWHFVFVNRGENKIEASTFENWHEKNR